ncbi:MAG: restriction endonuclease subunit S, partial [Clostridia bacterium]|nr:restriction endonuclease subunit S [Clostridia bacterium]
LGRVHYYNEETSNVVVNQFIIIIRTNPSMLIPAYLYSVLSSPRYQQIILSSVSGSTGMLVLNISTIRDFKIPIPSFDLQKQFEKTVSPLWNSITTNYSEISVLERLGEEIVTGLR